MPYANIFRRTARNNRQCNSQWQGQNSHYHPGRQVFTALLALIGFSGR